MTLILFLLLFLPPPTLCELPPDFRSLLEFKKGIHDPSGLVTTSWDVTTLPSRWRGVSAFNSSDVAVIDLSGLNLSGELKFSTLTSLARLQTLNLSNNHFTGRLVPSVGSIQSLQNLDLSNNQFYGPVPDRIADLYSLVNLNLSNNLFEGWFPTNLRNLQQLRYLDLKSNRFFGDVGRLFSEMHNVEYVDLSGNRFYGELFLESGKFSNVVNTMKYMDLSRNSISGGFGRSAGLFKNLEVLDLCNNKLNGVLPELGGMLNLKVLRVGRNFLFGMIPGGLFKTVMQLVEIDLSGNGFTGSPPIISSTNLKILNLSSNSLSSSLPSSIGSCSTVDFSENNISGDLSNMQNWGSTLEVVDISSNSLAGNLPDMTMFTNLISIKLHNNSISGSLPSALGLCLRLSSVDFSLNKLDGPILPSFFTSSTLAYLNLSKNQLIGPIPVGPMHSSHFHSHLESLDLSNNLLTGLLPPEIAELQKLKLLDIHNNNLSGELPNELTKLVEVEYVDLSGNHFVGAIPDMSQPTLKELNVSNNDFSGTVPSGLTNFPSSSFHPGNNLLKYPDGSAPSERKNGGNVRVPIIIGSIGTALLIVSVVAFYIVKSQDICRSYKFRDRTTSNRDAQFGRAVPPDELTSTKDDSKPTDSFSSDLLLTSTSRSLSGKEELLTEIVAHRFTDQNSSKTFSVSPLSSLPHFPDHQVIEQPIKLAVDSPDRLVGECTFLDTYLIFTIDDLSRAPAEVLGSSNHGTSFKATLDSGHVLTVKWLRVDLVKHRKVFAKEAKRIGSIRHPNIVPWRCYYWGSRKQERLIVSDYADGESLDLYLHESKRREHPLSVKQRLTISIEIAQCLHHLHQHISLPHGNLKPTNIILTGPTQLTRLTDYGLHRLLSPSGISEQLLNLGALGYRAPELAESTKPLPSFKSDIYAFGVILMELITGRSAGDIISGQVGAVDLIDWVQLCYREGRASDCYDRNINGMEDLTGVMDELLAVSLRCVLVERQRPDIRTLLHDLCSIAM